MWFIANLLFWGLLTFVRASHPLIVSSLMCGLGARWKGSKNSMILVWLEKEPRSLRSAEMVDRSCICWEELVFRVEKEKGWWQWIWSFVDYTLWYIYYMAWWEVITTPLRMWATWLQSECGHSHKSGINQSGTGLWNVSESHHFSGGQGPVSSLKMAQFLSCKIVNSSSVGIFRVMFLSCHEGDPEVVNSYEQLHQNSTENIMALQYDYTALHL